MSTKTPRRGALQAIVSWWVLVPSTSAVPAPRACDPKRSALNGLCQMHDVKSVFVVDGAAFPTASEKNPTLTILTLAWRARDYLAEGIGAGWV